MTTGSRIALLFGIITAVPAFAQEASAPGEPIVPAGVPADERVDVTGDGVADLVITGRTDRIPDPEQGLDGWYRRGVRPLPGRTILLRCTQNSSGYYRVPEGEALDTAAIRKGIHFKQLCWSGTEDPWMFGTLEQPFGPGIRNEQKGWYGMGEHNEGTLVLRSTLGPRTAIAAFQIHFNLPAGRIWVTLISSVVVHPRFAVEPVSPPAPKVEDPYGFGHDEQQPQVMVPPGVPPDEPIDLTSDDIPDLVITGENAPYHAPAPPLGTYFRGLRMLPGAALLMEKTVDGSYQFFMLHEGQELGPTELAMGLSTDRFRWAEPPRWPKFIEVLMQRYGSLRTADEPLGWLPATELLPENIVFRGTQYGRPMIGCFEIGYTTPGGELWVRLMSLVDEGEVLRVQ
jgi:hypothetical protein